MNSMHTVRRVAVRTTFSQDLEALLLQLPTKHASLSHDLESAATIGLDTLEDIKIRDLSDTENQALKQLIDRTNKHLQMNTLHFKHWTIMISEEVLQALELLRLTKGDDFTSLGLRDNSIGSLLVLAATAGLLTAKR